MRDVLRRLRQEDAVRVRCMLHEIPVALLTLLTLKVLADFTRSQHELLTHKHKHKQRKMCKYEVSTCAL